MMSLFEYFIWVFSVLFFWRKVRISLSENRQFSIQLDPSKYRAGMKKLHTMLKIGLLSLNIHQDIKRKPIRCSITKDERGHLHKV